MADIHPTSLISSQARLAEDVRIGPQCVIEGEVRVGPGTRLIGHVYLQGPLVLGAANALYPFTCIGFPPQQRGIDLESPSAGVRIGGGNVLREGTTIHCATASPDQTPTAIGDRNYFMANSHVGHDAQIGSDCVFANGSLLGGHVQVEDQVTIGGNSAAHQYCRLGRLSMLSGLCGVAKDVPPYCISYYFRTVGSLNIVGLRRAGLRRHRKPLQRAFDILYKQGHTNATAVQLIEAQLGEDPLCREFARFIRTSKRGVVAYQEKIGVAQ